MAAIIWQETPTAEQDLIRQEIAIPQTIIDLAASGELSIPEPVEVDEYPEGSVELFKQRDIFLGRLAVIAETAAKHFRKGGARQSEAYAAKLAEALDFVSNGSDDHPFLETEAEAKGINVSELARQVIVRARQWHVANAQIEASLKAGQKALRCASTVDALYGAMQDAESRIHSITAK